MDLIGLLKENIGSIIQVMVTPVSNWIIGKKREKQEYKLSTIKRWRDYIDAIEGPNLGSSFQDSVVYSEMKPLLKEDVRKVIEVPRNAIKVPARPGIAVEGKKTKQILLDEVSRIEREEWHLL